MKNDNNLLLNISCDDFGLLSSGEQTKIYTLSNRYGTTVKITNYGAIIVSLKTIDSFGKFADIVLGYDNIQGYQQDPYYLGAIIGRYAGRIDQGLLNIEGKEFQLTLNTPNSQLHGGETALNKQLWEATTLLTQHSVSLVLNHISPDGSNGFPGEVVFCVKYILTNDNELNVEYFAKTNKTTILNMTQHSYFNLAGHDQGNIFNHQLILNADYYLPMNENIYPTGEIKKVVNTPFDFTQPKRVGDDIDSTDEQIKIGQGYDNYWLLNETSISGNEFSAQLVDPNSGRRLTLYSDQPSIILYTANYIDGSQTGKNNTQYQRRDALCLEPQRAVNHEMTKKEFCSNSASVLLTPTEPFYSRSSYVFDTI